MEFISAVSASIVVDMFGRIKEIFLPASMYIDIISGTFKLPTFYYCRNLLILLNMLQLSKNILQKNDSKLEFLSKCPSVNVETTTRVLEI